MPFKEEHSIRFLNKILKQIKFIVEPETKLKYRLDKNPFYPFTQIESFKFVYEYRLLTKSLINLMFSYVCFGFVTEFLQTIINSKFQIYFLLWISAFVTHCFTFFFLARSFIFIQKRRLVIDLLNRNYSFFVSDDLVIKNDLHQIYIRLIERYVVKNQRIFCLVLDGKGIDKLELCSFCNNFELLRKLAQKLCLNLGLNYFDMSNKSKYHQILNYCYSEDSQDDFWKHLLNQNRIIISKNAFYWKNLLDKNYDFSESNLISDNDGKTTELFSVSQLVSEVASVRSMNSSTSHLQKVSNFDQAQEAVLSFNQLKNQLDMLSQQIKAIQNLKNE
ncbi:unnamed protein product [Brachionus calyciflorus]|uniref:Transmembrane protein n=1 Tax=Brachionus calyciflorus TaxID=104777 RepID=A0A813M9Z5_9BILA|nr:unnamed protein product [Brachionus calyciflorus]